MKDLDKTTPISLARIMNAGADIGAASSDDWHDDELAAMLAHQLAAPLAADLQSLSGDASRQFKDFLASGKPAPKTFADLLHDEHPPIVLLECTKQLAKQYRSHTDSPLQKVATVLYYASIFVAQYHCGQRITDLSDADLEQGVRWVLGQPWVDGKTRAIFGKRELAADQRG